MRRHFLFLRSRRVRDTSQKLPVSNCGIEDWICRSRCWTARRRILRPRLWHRRVRLSQI